MFWPSSCSRSVSDASPSFSTTPMPTAMFTTTLISRQPTSTITIRPKNTCFGAYNMNVSISESPRLCVKSAFAFVARFSPIATIQCFKSVIILSLLVSVAPGARAQSPPVGKPICIGNGLDVSALGILSTLVLPTVIGLSLWLLFAILRPRYRQVYALREWFVPQGLRPRPLSPSIAAFLSPNVPLIPSVTTETSSFVSSAARNAELFPSDEELSQRTLWTGVKVVSVWTILGLAGLLPLYMVTTPCLAHSAYSPKYGGMYSTLQDLSLLRLLQLLESIEVPSTDVRIVSSAQMFHAHTRIIILTVFTIALGVIPTLFILLREFNTMVAYRERWHDVRCQGLDMGWLGAQQAPGLVGWGEKRVKDFLVKTGLSSSLETNEANDSRSRRRRRTQGWNEAEKGRFEIDVQSLFSIGDTTHLALLIDERDEILENLEIAETKYIHSFRLTTPDPSIADFQPPLPPISEDPEVPPKPDISRPRPLVGSTRRRRRGRNPAFGASSLPPTSYVMPSQYYKIRGVQGISGGQFTNSERELPPPAPEPTLSDSINQRVVGSRFQEVNNSSTTVGHIPMGSQVAVDRGGHLSPVRQYSDSPIPDPGLYGPNTHSSWDTAAFSEGLHYNQWYHRSEDPILEASEEDWVDVMRDSPEAVDHGEEYPTDTRRRPRPPRARNGIEEHRETFPLRNRAAPAPDEVPPLHLRVQPRQPFVRPLSGLNHETLGTIYADINMWRSRLKAINTEISDVQRECYNDIADGARIKGWLLIGRGLRFLPGVQLIEGRAKEDIRWDELQNEVGFWYRFAYWTAVATISIMLGVILTAVAGLFMSTAPDFAHYFPFLMPFITGNWFGAGIATCLVPAVAAILYISLALAMVHYTGLLNRSISVSGSQRLAFKVTFLVLVVIAGVWLSFISIGVTESIADGLIYMGTFALLLMITIALIFPGLLLLQPVRLLQVLRAEHEALTPRQRFRAVYPRTYNPSYALGCCMLAVVFASAFTVLFPLVAPAALLLLMCTLIAHWFLVGYVYGRTHSQTGGLLQIWILRRLGTFLAFQPLLLGLVLLSRLLWVEGGVLCGVALFVSAFAEGYCAWKTTLPGRRTLTPITRDSLDTFKRTARPGPRQNVDEEGLSLVSSARNTRIRGSFASILDMMSLTLAVVPSPSEARGPVPLATETLDDLTATERAARTHPDAPPHLPPLPFADHAEEMAGILYAPELLAPPPVIWLPNDSGGIGRSEAYDLQKYHELRVTLDVRVKEDVLARRSWASQTHRAPSTP
ncbi:hypothetical protein B0H21DRAFT_776325 [Amylocystis lapponica]|nr:hypothetical protein B0H21DRAFT_776325 [Amylocystis lapponica]